MGIWEKIKQFFRDWYLKLSLEYSKLNSEQKRRLALILTAAFALILIFSVIISTVNSSSGSAPGRRSGGPERTSFIIPIPADELFLPEEPDFLPDVILERQRQPAWSEQDVERFGFWQDPLRQGEEYWRGRLEAEVNDFMERIP